MSAAKLFLFLVFVSVCVLAIQGRRRRCRALPDLSANLTVRCTRGRRVRSRCTLRCPPGFELSSRHRSLTCRSLLGKLVWNRYNFLRKAKCVRQQCTPLTAIRPAPVFRYDCGNNSLYEQTCNLTCPRVGHVLSGGSSTITCQADQHWSSDLTAYSCAYDQRCPRIRRRCRRCRNGCNECPAACSPGHICCPYRCGTRCIEIPTTTK